MGKALADNFTSARNLFAESMMRWVRSLPNHLGGPGGPLTLTENAQPALMAVSLATMRVLGGSRARPRTRCCLRGGALARRVFGTRGCRRIDVRRYGAALAHSRPRHAGRRPGRRRRDGGIAGLEFDAAAAIASRSRTGAGVPGRKRQWRRPGRGIGRQGRGRTRGRDRETKGAKRAMLLPVSAPFHCALMQPAADAMAQALAG